MGKQWGFPKVVSFVSNILKEGNRVKQSSCNEDSDWEMILPKSSRSIACSYLCQVITPVFYYIFYYRWVKLITIVIIIFAMTFNKVVLGGPHYLLSCCICFIANVLERLIDHTLQLFHFDTCSSNVHVSPPVSFSIQNEWFILFIHSQKSCRLWNKQICRKIPSLLLNML